MRKLHDLTGEKFGKLTVTGFAGRTSYYAPRWHVRCECGATKVTLGNNLRRGYTRSCGCTQGGRSGLHGAVYRSHGLSDKTPLYTAWINIRQRCQNPNNSDFRIYGGRGIQVCRRWNGSFEAFMEDMGPTWQRGLTIDRIDSNGHYEPSNCRWVPMSEQWKTRRSHGNKRAPDGPNPSPPTA